DRGGNAAVGGGGRIEKVGGLGRRRAGDAHRRTAQRDRQLEADGSGAERRPREGRCRQRQPQRAGRRRAGCRRAEHHQQPDDDDGQGSSASTASLTVATPRTLSGAGRRSATLLFGTTAERKPSWAAARRRGSRPATARTSPVSPTSPSTTTSPGRGRPMEE